MNYIDIFLIGCIGYAVWTGFRKGFIIELFTFLALFFGLYAGIHFSDFAAEFLETKVGLTSEYMPVISFTITFLLIGAMVYFAGKAIEKVVKVVQLSLLNKLGGILFSVSKMIFILGGIILLLESYDEKSDFIDEETKSGSLFYNPIKSITLFAIPAFEESTIFLKNTLQNKDLIQLNDSEATDSAD